MDMEKIIFNDKDSLFKQIRRPLTNDVSFLTKDHNIQQVANIENKKDILVGYAFFYEELQKKMQEAVSKEAAFRYATDRCLEEGYLTPVIEQEGFKMTGPLLVTPLSKYQKPHN